MVSFDVESFFTNVPTEETINLILDLAFKDNNVTFHGLTKKQLRRVTFPVRRYLLRPDRWRGHGFTTLSSKEQAETVLVFLTQHSNIKFTIEEESNNRLPFLDTCVYRTDNAYKTTLYRKKTFTGVYLNWNSLTSRRYKVSLIKCLAERIWRICTVEEDKQLELERLKIIFQRNEYPLEAIEETLQRFLERKAQPQETRIQP